MQHEQQKTYLRSMKQHCVYERPPKSATRCALIRKFLVGCPVAETAVFSFLRVTRCREHALPLSASERGRPVRCGARPRLARGLHALAAPARRRVDRARAGESRGGAPPRVPAAGGRCGDWSRGRVILARRARARAEPASSLGRQRKNYCSLSFLYRLTCYSNSSRNGLIENEIAPGEPSI